MERFGRSDLDEVNVLLSRMIAKKAEARFLSMVEVVAGLACRSAAPADSQSSVLIHRVETTGRATTASVFGAHSTLASRRVGAAARSAVRMAPAILRRAERDFGVRLELVAENGSQ